MGWRLPGSVNGDEEFNLAIGLCLLNSCNS